jgi:hypothetical protein
MMASWIGSIQPNSADQTATCSSAESRKVTSTVVSLWIVFRITTVAAMTYLDEMRAAALDLARGCRWQQALRLLDADVPADPADRARIALTAAEVAVDCDWFAGTALSADRLATAERLCDSSWDLDFLRLRHDYRGQLFGTGALRFGPDGKDQTVVAELRERAGGLAERAPDQVRNGWARMYLGLIMDNLLAERDAAAEHYAAALRAGEAGDDLLTREALRHLGDHDRDRGDLITARQRWERAIALGARAGLVAGTLSQQMLLAVLARDTGDENGAVRLAEEIARWAGAVSVVRLRDQAEAFLAGAQVA